MKVNDEIIMNRFSMAIKVIFSLLRLSIASIDNRNLIIVIWA